MKKMPCVFERTFDGPRNATITDKVAPAAAWVLAGEGDAFIKRDGTACAVIGGKLFKRYDAKKGKTPPLGAIPCDPAPDEVTGHWPHWVEVKPDDPASKWHNEAWALWKTDGLPDSTYELCGPAFSANPEGLRSHVFISHTAEMLTSLTRIPLTFEFLRTAIGNLKHEGVVWHHPDGRMAKLRRADFGFAWPIRDGV